MKLQEKEVKKIKHVGNPFRKNLQIKVWVNFRLTADLILDHLDYWWKESIQ